MTSYSNKRNVKLQKIINFLSKDILYIYGNTEGIVIRHLKDQHNVDEFTLDWVNSNRPEKYHIIETSKAKAIITGQDIKYTKRIKLQNKVIIVVQNPRLSISKIGNEFFLEKLKPGIHLTAVIHPEAEIGNNIFIGANVSIGKCKIGDNVKIHPNVVIYDNVILLNNVHIHANASIGMAGLGCERDNDESLVCFPHLGGVRIEKNVEIGAGCLIAKGALSNTVIGTGTKINAGCYIAHNTRIGCNVWISPKVNISGSVKIDDNVTIYSGAVFREQIHIGKDSIIGMGSVVLKNVPSNEIWVGNPARKLKNK